MRVCAFGGRLGFAAIVDGTGPRPRADRRFSLAAALPFSRAPERTRLPAHLRTRGTTMKSNASAVWEGGLKDGRGTMSSGNGACSATPYNFAKRFEGAAGPGTTPEELIAAAHSSCFAMASSGELGKAGFTPTKLEVSAVVTLEPVDGKPTVTSS